VELTMRLLILAVVVAACHPSPSPGRAYTHDDLASPDPKLRAAAAAYFRKTWQPPPRARWDALVADIHDGDTRAAVEAKLPDPSATNPDGWQLDDKWALLCGFREPADTVTTCTVESRTRVVVPPLPPGYTGKWTTYYVSGVPRFEAEYKDGVEVGTSFAYWDDGSKSDVWRYDPTGARVEEIGYYYGGTQMTHQGKYTAGGQHTGVWIYYAADGKVLESVDYDAVKP
jgi:hypothetical protein